MGGGTGGVCVVCAGALSLTGDGEYVDVGLCCDSAGGDDTCFDASALGASFVAVLAGLCGVAATGVGDPVPLGCARAEARETEEPEEVRKLEVEEA